MHRCHDDVQPLEQLRLLVEAAVLEDVHLDAGEQPERCQLGVHLVDDVQLLTQPFRRQTVGHLQGR